MPSWWLQCQNGPHGPGDRPGEQGAAQDEPGPDAAADEVAAETVDEPGAEHPDVARGPLAPAGRKARLSVLAAAGEHAPPDRHAVRAGEAHPRPHDPDAVEYDAGARMYVQDPAAHPEALHPHPPRMADHEVADGHARLAANGEPAAGAGPDDERPVLAAAQHDRSAGRAELAGCRLESGLA